MRKMKSVLLLSAALLLWNVQNAEAQVPKSEWGSPAANRPVNVGEVVAELPQFETGEYELLPAQIEYLENVAIPTMRDRLDSGECMAYTSTGWTNYQVFRGSANEYEEHQTKEFGLSEDRWSAANSYIAHTDSALTKRILPFVRVRMGEHPKTVTWECVEPGTDFVALIADLRAEHDEILRRLDMHADESARQHGDLMDAMLETRDAVLRTESAVEGLGTLAHFTAGVGWRWSSEFGDGLVATVGGDFPRWGLQVYAEAYGEWNSHERGLYNRPHPDVAVTHWGSWYTANLMIQKYFDFGTDLAGLSFFLEGGPGVILADYAEPNTKSIGWYDNGFFSIIRVGAFLRLWQIDLKGTLGQEIYHFPWSSVDPIDLATGEYGVALQGGIGLVIHLDKRRD